MKLNLIFSRFLRVRLYIAQLHLNILNSISFLISRIITAISIRKPQKARNGAFPLIAVAVFLAGCSPQGQGFLSNGIGAKLPASDTVKSAQLLRQYFFSLCAQAELLSDSNGKAVCNLSSAPSRKWTLIVYQGFNDIDRRCDAYLEWLDNKKRSKGPIISQIGSIGATTTGILGITGSATSAITIVGLAFDLINKSIENYHSRLILEVDQSTVNSIVLRARHNFREGINGRKFTSKPEAEYVLRSYLRLCLPFAIETNINDYSTFGSLGVSPNRENSINHIPIAQQKFHPVTKPGTRIRRFIRTSLENRELVTNYLANNHNGLSIAKFVRNGRTSSQRRMIAELNIP